MRTSKRNTWTSWPRAAAPAWHGACPHGSKAGVDEHVYKDQGWTETSLDENMLDQDGRIQRGEETAALVTWLGSHGPGMKVEVDTSRVGSRIDRTNSARSVPLLLCYATA